MDVLTSSIIILFCTTYIESESSSLKCPTSVEEWRKKDQDYGCNDKEIYYHCLFTENFVITEGCARRKTISKGKCPQMNRNGTVSDKSFTCSTEKDDCPKQPFFSYNVFQYPACLKYPNSTKREGLVIRKEDYLLENTTQAHKENGDDDMLVNIKLGWIHIVAIVGAVLVVLCLLVGLPVCVVKLCQTRIKRRNSTANHVNLTTVNPITSRHNLVQFDELDNNRTGGLPIAIITPAASMGTLYVNPQPHTYPSLSRSHLVLAGPYAAISRSHLTLPDLPLPRSSSREELASCMNLPAPTETFNIDVMNGMGAGQSGSPYLSPLAPRRFKSTETFQYINGTPSQRVYYAEQTQTAHIAFNQRRLSL